MNPNANMNPGDMPDGYAEQRIRDLEAENLKLECRIEDLTIELSSLEEGNKGKDIVVDLFEDQAEKAIALQADVARLRTDRDWWKSTCEYWHKRTEDHLKQIDYLRGINDWLEKRNQELEDLHDAAEKDST